MWSMVLPLDPSLGQAEKGTRSDARRGAGWEIHPVRALHVINAACRFYMPYTKLFF